MVAVHMGSNPLAFYQYGNPFNVVGCFLGSNNLGVGTLSLAASITGSTLPIASQDGNSLNFVVAPTAALWVDPSCTNINDKVYAPVLGTSALALLQASGPYLPTSEGGGKTPHIWLNGVALEYS
jgi:hypothetical protein